MKPSLWDAFKQYLGDAAPGGALNPEVTPQGLLDVAAMASMPVPVVGDAIGLAADAKRLRDNPEERNLLNYVLMAAGALPLVPSGLSAASKTLDKAGDASRTRTKYEIAHEIAQRNAALPVEKGGLGLPPDNTAMDRAKAMGFDTEAYHFSRHGGDYAKLDSGEFAVAPFDAVGTHVGSKQAAHDRFLSTTGLSKETKGSTYPLLIKKGEEFVSPNRQPAWYENQLFSALMDRSGYETGRISMNEATRNLRRDLFGAYDSIPYINDVEAAGEISRIVPPKNIRSRFAAFDPMKRDSSGLLAGLGVPILSGGLLALLMGSEDAQAGQ